MKARDLIAALSKLDPDLPVIMPGEDEDFCEVMEVFPDLAQFRDGEVQLADERDPHRYPVIRLFGPPPPE